MIIEFKFKNYKSFQEEQVFSLQALAGRNKSDNTFEVTLATGKTIKLLKSAVVYGANASGKTNFIEAFRTFQTLLLMSNRNQNGVDIQEYNPFLFESTDILEENYSSFHIEWISDDKVRHEYHFSFNGSRFFEEELFYYPNGRAANLFKRAANFDKQLDVIHLGKHLKDKRIDKKVLSNQLYLSKIGGIEGHEQLGDIYRWFVKLSSWNGLDGATNNLLKAQVIKWIALEGNDAFVRRLENLLSVADTGVVGIKLKSASQEQFPKFATGRDREILMNRLINRPFTTHPLYLKEELIDMIELPLESNSSGTQTLFTLGGLILRELERGGVIFYDEFDNSLHPKLCRFLIRLFHNPKTNPKNAQLVFATHEVSLLDKAIFRKDQIWFTEKDKYGKSTLYSAQDFEDVRDDTPFDKWYMAGKFGGYPKIKELNFIFDNE